METEKKDENNACSLFSSGKSNELLFVQMGIDYRVICSNIGFKSSDLSKGYWTKKNFDISLNFRPDFERKMM
jgi:hypothetical protein